MSHQAGTNPYIDAGLGDASRLKVWVESFVMPGGSQIYPEKSGVTAIVGANNSGKSTLLDSLDMMLTNSNYGDVPRLVEDITMAQEGSRDDLVAWLNQHARWGRSQNETEVGYRRLNLRLTDHEIASWGSGLVSGRFWTHYFRADYYAGHFGSERAQAGAAPETPVQVLYERPALMKELDRICFDVFGEHLTLDDESPSFALMVGQPEIDRPGPDEDKGPYRDAIGKLRPLHRQGHGMRSWLTVITQLVTGTYPIILADEPEVFLHPPQARALGTYLSRLAQSNNCQVILATHDRNLLTGLLDENSDLTVVRLDRQPTRTHAHQLPSAKVRGLWSDPLLRYGNALDGLFHRAVVVAEAHGDCTFYRAALDHHQTIAQSTQHDSADASQHEQPSRLAASDVMFAPSNGKHAMPKLVAALTAVKVPVVVTPDLDILNPNEPVLRSLVEEMTQDGWGNIEPLRRQATNSLTTPTALTQAALVRDALIKAFDELLSDNPNAVWDKDTKREINPILRAAGGPSDRLKHEGVNYAAGEEYQTLHILLAELNRIGIVPVRVGELERFARGLNQSNKTLWLEEALQQQVYTNRDAQDHVAELLSAAKIQMETQGSE